LSGVSADEAYLRDWQLRILRRAGVQVQAGCKVLDFGCSEGGLVRAYRAANYEAYGCDLAGELGSGPDLDPIAAPYRLPYENSTFDLVVSYQVLEHVQNPRESFAEIARVLAPSGAGLHLFPARYTPLEPHTFVPLATLVHARPWLWLWALAGVRNEFQRGLSAAETVEKNATFLRDHTSYMPRHAIIRYAQPLSVRFVEREAIEASLTRLRILTPVASVLGRVYSALRSRVVLLQHAGV
jgi:SAM-dependent methyltransferase